VRDITNLYHRVGGALSGRLYRHAWKLAIGLAAAIVATGTFVLWPRSPSPAALPPATISAADMETAQDRGVIVYVNGAVKSPGLFTLTAGLRVSDAIVAAGGVTADADPTCLPNLAAHLKDAKQITVPYLGHCGKSLKKVKLDINIASREQLLAVPGVDAGLADAIIAYREAYGGFQSLTELKSGLGIDSTFYKQLAKSLTVP
jgi:competence protein ComEA